MKNLNKKTVANLNSLWLKISAFILGFLALLWFLIRVIPKPGRASYPCQQAAFPLASAFVIWFTGVISSYLGLKHFGKLITQNKKWILGTGLATGLFIAFWVTLFPTNIQSTIAAIPEEYKPAIGFDWQPSTSNQSLGEAKGIYPGRVVMSRDAKATKWAGRWNLEEDQWWLDKNTDTELVSNMLSVILQKLTETKSDKKAWQQIFEYYNKTAHGSKKQGYKKGEVVAIKINLNNSSEAKKDNQTDATPQMVLAMVRQLVYEAGVRQEDILIYEVRRQIFPYMLELVWKEFKDVKFMQQDPPTEKQPINPAYGDHTGFEAAKWVEGVSYSALEFNEAKLIPQQIMDATYLINMALLKLHSYPYNYMEDGDEGQTAITMTGKNHCGSIKGTPELHAILNTKKLGTRNAYSPLVDLAASPNLGGKTILYLLDGLYCGRKWRSYPLHFPNPPFNNKVEPYENPEWPACVLASFDGVAIQSVGLDIMYAQSKNNLEEAYHNVPRIIVRDNADDFLREMATPQNAPSGIKYMQGGKPVESLGVFEHWNNDNSMEYSRNLDPENGKGIEFIYLPL